MPDVSTAALEIITEIFKFESGPAPAIMPLPVPSVAPARPAACHVKGLKQAAGTKAPCPRTPFIFVRGELTCRIWRSLTPTPPEPLPRRDCAGCSEFERGAGRDGRQRDCPRNLSRSQTQHPDLRQSR